MRVFISSVVTGFEGFRTVASSAVRSLDHEVLRAEDFAASPSSPQVACLSAVRAADVVIVILGRRYGEVQASGKSATHEEFDEARRTKQVFVFVQTGGTPEPRQAASIDEAQSWAAGHYTGQFHDDESLRAHVIRALHRWELSNVAGQVDPDEMKRRALDGLPSEDRRYHSSAPSLAISIVGAPQQSILRPSELEAVGFQRQLKQQALFGTPPIFDTAQGTEVSIEGHAVTLPQDTGRLTLSEEGSFLLVLPLPPPEGLSAIIEEDVIQALVTGFQFAAQVLQTIDPTERLSSLAVAVALLNSSHSGWRTLAA